MLCSSLQFSSIQVLAEQACRPDRGEVVSMCDVRSSLADDQDFRLVSDWSVDFLSCILGGHTLFVNDERLFRGYDALPRAVRITAVEK